MHTNGLRVGIENRYACGYCGAIRKALVHNRIEIDRRKRGLGPQVQGHRLSGLPTGWHMVTRLSCDAHMILRAVMLPEVVGGSF